MFLSSVNPLFFCAFFLFTIALAAEKVPEFNYLEPEKWGSLDPSYATCSTGKMQSPIDINTNHLLLNTTLQPLPKTYHIYNASITTDGIEVKVMFNGRGELIIDSKTYKLKQMHWHTPSEHSFNGFIYAAELHEVHVAADGSRAVVGILYKYGNPDPILTMLKAELDELAKNPCEGAEVEIPVFESRFLKRRPHNYYRYTGSLTTPPCDQNVVWTVISKVKTISEDQVEALKAPLCVANKKKNARPIQPLNGRYVQAFDDH